MCVDRNRLIVDKIYEENLNVLKIWCVVGTLEKSIKITKKLTF